MPRINATLSLKGESGKHYKFNLFEDESNFEPVSAIYIFTNRKQNVNQGFSHTKIYIGKTKDLSQRFTKHHKKDCINKYASNCFGVHYCDESELDEIEKDLLAINKTKCNDRLN